MTINFNIPAWGVWLLCGMFAISAVVNIWHSLMLRRYMSARTNAERRKQIEDDVQRYRAAAVESAGHTR